jgi:hypothetical protein
LTAQEQIAKLESLLDRIRRNVGKPRTAAPVMAAAAAPAEPPPAAEPLAVAAIPQPVAATPPPAYVEELEEPIPDIEDLDMSDVEVVELAVEEGSAVSAAEDEAPDTIDEPIPESAPRPAAAMADVAEPEAPIKTPPPESGRQVVAPVAPIIHDDSVGEADLSGSGDVDSLLEADHSGAPLSRAPAGGGPTMEQLGATVELMGADAPAAALELDAGPVVRPAAPPADELELELPRQGFAGGYEAPLAPPSGARADLRSREASPPPPAAESFARSIEAPRAPEQPVAAAGPTIVERPALEARAAEVIAAAPAPKPPETFLDLLDVSLALRP